MASTYKFWAKNRRMSLRNIALSIFLAILTANSAFAAGFVTRKDNRLYLDKKPYIFVGTNYWYGSFLGINADRSRGIERLRKELDFLKQHGVANLRVIAAAEGTRQMNGVTRVGPSAHPQPEIFNLSVLEGLDILLDEMAKRDMKAVIFLSNNWEWSGGFQQYLIWNGELDQKWLTEKPSWDELRDNVSKFYSCVKCIEQYHRQVETVVNRRNTVNKVSYKKDPTIMAWEVANEPRPMRPASNEAYAKFLTATTALIKKLDKRHLVTLGHEGSIGTESVELFEGVHRDRNVDYLTIHIWPKNWQWFESGKMAEQYDIAAAKTSAYIDESTAVAKRLDKPLVIEEFGLPRDGQSFDIAAPTRFRDRYYELVLSRVGKDNIAGANFWAFGGTARPVKDQPFWKQGDDLMGDPPMEEQGLYTVFDSDRSTWGIVEKFTNR